MNCPRCQNKIGCSCSGGSQLVKASDSTQVCSKCITQYEEYLALLNKAKYNKTN